MISGLARAPKGALYLGLGGIVPFAVSALLMLVNAGGETATARLWAQIGLVSLLVYAAAILSFLGGTRWGRELQANPERPVAVALAWSILPAVLAWAAVVISLPPLAAPHFGIVMMMGGFGAMLTWDLGSVREGQWPAWYGPLRTVLSVAAIAALAAGLFVFLGAGAA